MKVKDQITKVLADVANLEFGYVHLEVPGQSEHGDFSTNVAMRGAPEGTSPRDYAAKLVEKLQKDKKLSEIVEKIEVAGPGFINFWLKNDVLVDNLTQIDGDKERYGRGNSQKGKKVMVEFAHPNTHKAFHIGHLRNITTGESIVRLLEAVGVEVTRANYQGDVGLHIAKALWGIKKLGFKDLGSVKDRVEFLGKAYATGAGAYEEDEQAKKEIQEINGKIYSKEDEDINKLYQETRKWSLDYFDGIYKRVYTKFDRLYFESECADEGKKIALKALEDGIFVESKGAIIFPGSKYGLHDRVFITGTGAPTYEAKDLRLVQLQLSEYGSDKILHVVGPEQAGYFKVVFLAIEKIMPETKGKEAHIPYGWVRLKEGKMSSRTGQVILGDKLLDDAKSEVVKGYKTDEETTEEIAVGAVKYSFLLPGREKDIAFDLQESIALEGNSGPYLQYTYARTQSVLAKSKTQNPKSKDNLPFEIGNLKLEINDEEGVLLRSFVHFPEVVAEAAEKYAPNLVCNYLYDLAQKYNTFYNKHKIIGGENESLRLALTSATGTILRNGLNLLGIKAPEKM